MNRLDELVTIIGLVADDVPRLMLGQQRRGLIDVMLLTGGEDPFDRPPLGIWPAPGKECQFDVEGIRYEK